MSVHIRPLQLRDIINILPLVPEEWHFNSTEFFHAHYLNPYFYSLLLCDNHDIIGHGNVVINGGTAWIGNILVHSEHRKKGYGTMITDQLIEYAGKKGATAFMLIATELGRPVYEKIGFQVTSSYVFFSRDHDSKQHIASSVRRLEETDHIQLASLDTHVTGEDRDQFLRQFIPSAYCINVRDHLEGVYYRTLGNGQILARSALAGLSLLSLKIMEGAESLVIPEENALACEFVKNNGFVETKRAPRMHLGEPRPWHPECVFNRGAGYCG